MHVSSARTHPSELIDRAFDRRGEPSAYEALIRASDPPAGLGRRSLARWWLLHTADRFQRDRDSERAMEGYERGLEYVDPSEDLRCYVRLLNMAAYQDLLQTHLASAVERLVAVRWRARDSRDPRIKRNWVRATANLACCLRVLGDPASTLELNREAYAYEHETTGGKPRTATVAMLLISMVESGDLSGVDPLLEELDAARRHAAEPAEAFREAEARAYVAMARGQMTQALELSERALALLGDTGDADDLCSVLSIASRSALALERLDVARDHADRMIEASADLIAGSILPLALRIRGQIAHREGDHETVFRLLEEATDLSSSRSRSTLAPALLGVIQRFQETVHVHESELGRANRRLARANAKLSEARDRAESAASTRHTFLSSMSHEIRTPLHGVLGNAELLMDTRLDRTQREMVGMIQRSAGLTLTIVDDILDLRKLEEGKLQLDPRPFSLLQPPRDVLSSLHPLAEARSNTLVLEADSDLPERVSGDDRRLQQVLLNLVSNAIKFTQSGRITVSVKAFDHGVRFEVMDTGIGIPEHRLQAIFNAYEQASASTARRAGGTGLGLPIVRHLVALMGGTTGVRSIVGQGSTFWVELPLTVASVMAEAPSLEACDLQGVRVLVAEDHPVNQVVIERMLRSLGAEVHLVSGGLPAIDAVPRWDPDVLLLDLHMPDLNGDVACRRIRAGGFDGPVLALTASAMDADRNLCVEAGMDGFLTKPLTRACLAREVRRVWDRARVHPNRRAS